jgi:hypothetical protein
VLINSVVALGAVFLIGAAFGAAGAYLRRRFGRLAVPAFWLATTAALAAAGTARSASLERDLVFGYQPALRHPAWMFGLFGVSLFLILAPAAAMLVRRVATPTPSVAARRAALLVVPGLLIMLTVGLALDIAGVSFLPPR